jgi:hypothetical protein
LGSYLREFLCIMPLERVMNYTNDWEAAL